MSALHRPCTGQKVPRLQRPSNFALLLMRYLAGQISDEQWQQLSEGLDAAALDPHERTALVTFYLGACAEGDEVALPLAEELAELLEVARG